MTEANGATALDIWSKAEAVGERDGDNAASWLELTREDALALMLALESGDPVAYDSLPAPDLSGQWADGLTPHGLAVEVLGETVEDYCAHAYPGDDTAPGWVESELCERYETAYTAAVENRAGELARVALSADVRMRATFDVVTPESAEIGDVARSGWVDPCNPWGSFEQDSDDDSADPAETGFDNLWDAAGFVLEFPGAVWDYCEGESEQDIRTGEWKSVTLHVDGDDGTVPNGETVAGAVFAVADAMRAAGIR